MADKDRAGIRCRQVIVLGWCSIQTWFQGQALTRKTLKSSRRATLDVFGVYAVIRQCRDSHKKNRLGMLGVIDTENISRGYFPR